MRLSSHLELQYQDLLALLEQSAPLVCQFQFQWLPCLIQLSCHLRSSYPMLMMFHPQSQCLDQPA
jgi:hypothetical protein